MSPTLFQGQPVPKIISYMLEILLVLMFCNHCLIKI